MRNAVYFKNSLQVCNSTSLQVKSKNIVLQSPRILQHYPSALGGLISYTFDFKTFDLQTYYYTEFFCL